MNNLFILEGTLVREPETKTIGDRTVIKFSIAENVRTKDAEGKWVDGESNFYDLDYWTENPQFWLQRLQKGTSVVVKGTLRQEKWEKDGQKHSKIGFNVTDINYKWLPTIEQQNAFRNNKGASASEPVPPAQTAPGTTPAAPAQNNDEIPF